MEKDEHSISIPQHAAPDAGIVWCQCGARLGTESNYIKVCPECGLYADGCPECDGDMLPVPGEPGMHECMVCYERVYIAPADPAIYSERLD